ncbi:hypothetical protein SDRG_10180 [Saprolegnia diclina VS20]|uniref:Major facilitator superfamily (MFS) profile domain-containing protein n=1 Tax=Saprolegnia diclina (strain VS20) TaxID=1156394 RepID=T0QEK7_SAPDV|nr:hypothetical protein SDRG_10180 [Saprolegnia diclina VS20]EQC31980.1 hypothetical protein SDRG_10180 [Saprolegnia diclina VS20]|eukprot:XP_008614382.1 hypothetical protein SDRG_10180 [Saprolegnia diclina VS20]
MLGQRHDVARHERNSRASIASSLGKPEFDYIEAKTPTAMETGGLRAGDAPVYTSPEILALLFQYAAIGVVYGGISGMQYPILTAYFNLEGNILNSATALMSLGWSLKVFFGMLTDCVPICGYHRKPYILIGWTLTAILLLIVALKPAGEPAPDPHATANGSVLALLCAVACFCYIMADVAQDALLVAYSQREPVARRGRLQALIYSVRALAMPGMSAVSGFCLNSTRMTGTYDWDIGVNGYFWILAATSILNVPVVWFWLKDVQSTTRVSVSSYLARFWTLAQKRVVWQVMLYIFFFAFFTSYISTTAAPYVALYWAKVENLNSSLMGILGSVLYAGIIAATGKYGTRWNWRYMLVLTTLTANAIDAVVAFCTIYNVVRNQWFFLGVPLTEQLPLAVNFVVGSFVIVELAEEGSEGVLYGLLTTIHNLPGVFGPMITNVVDANFSVSSRAIKKDLPETRNEVAWTYAIAYASTVIGCLWVVLLPSQKEAVLELKKHGGSYPTVAGCIFYAFFVILATSITGTMTSMFDSTNCLKLAGGHGCPEETSQLYLLGIFIPAGLALLGILYFKFRLGSE